MKLTTGILTVALVAGGVWTAKAAAQNPDAIDNARSIAKSLQQKQASDTNAALNAAGVGQPSKPAAGSPAPAIKPAVIPGSNPAPSPVAQPAVRSAAVAHTELKNVEIVPAGDAIRIELSSSGAVTPRVSKLSSPARILVELPATAAATAHNHIAVGNGGVKGVRIGMDGKTPPTTSVVVDLEQALAFDVTPGPADKLILTVHTQGTTAASKPASKPAAPVQRTAPAPAVAKSAPAAKLVTVAKTTPSKAEAPAKVAAPAAKTVAAKAAPAPKAVAAKAAPAKAAAPAAAPAEATMAEAPKPQPKVEQMKWAMTGRRDPFFSPVVQQPTGSGCSTGKKCLEIGNINLRGVVKSDSGFIAVVTNNLNKAYFLRENDPVFNGYVVKITGDSVTFQETVEDKLGKPFTREVVKRIFTPAV